MALEDGDDVDPRAADPVDDTVVPDDALADVVAIELGYLAAGSREAADLVASVEELVDPPRRSDRIIALDVRADLLEIGGGLRGPDNTDAPAARPTP